ncbi:hypothetical protein BJ742DRAFT_804848 [Cladochytrium replicatum]|nr:hypothetical protein BJ742DRAFT_804848 [Cladochytrium replicatum]
MRVVLSMARSVWCSILRIGSMTLAFAVTVISAVLKCLNRFRRCLSPSGFCNLRDTGTSSSRRRSTPPISAPNPHTRTQRSSSVSSVMEVRWHVSRSLYTTANWT